MSDPPNHYHSDYLHSTPGLQIEPGVCFREQPAANNFEEAEIA
jgi:hypothetical protein